MANVRDSARTYGKSDPIDALAVARAALRERDLPIARLDGPDREVRLLLDHREDLVAERTRIMSRLRWHLHELDPSWEPKRRSLNRLSTFTSLEERLIGIDGLVARLALNLTRRCRELTIEINALESEITTLVEQLAPSLLAIYGCGPLTAAKIVGETAGIGRFRSRDAFARHNGTAPISVCRRTRLGIGCLGPATDNSTQLFTASRSPKPTGIPKRVPCSRAARPAATATSKRSASSSAGSPTSSTAR
jgi:transposase